MSAHPTGVQAGRTTPHARPRLTLTVERVLGTSARQVVSAEFGFDLASPLAVSAEFTVENGPCARWRIGRDLLWQGLHTRSGIGDVQIWPSHPGDRTAARLRLVSGDMAALFELPIPPLVKWLEHTYAVVPAGQELCGVDWGATAADLLAGPRGALDR
ncbi:SsgA family sporulation/cell division regulator [Streptomyces sp. BPTC-684]|uniref:SsgA family sporulation/cell division regulator n=1 Tax=Streptomyces sp. BPTC-684 TaxID=3043734 RepID=UPI0024B1D9A6|nr:SsgA family sporulation/cell division regulator [Streptomyces sp. BPTC-684]WHM41007.1 SsgA family sporulation/cell division regulator [Streptomyces sp. BPTC-684]